MQVYVGQFNEKDIYDGKDTQAVEDAKAKTGLQYTNTKFVKKGRQHCRIENLGL